MRTNKQEDETMSSTVDTTGDDSLPPRNTDALSAPVTQAVNPLPKCVCSWKNCRAYQKAFREDKHRVFDGVIRIKLLQGHDESVAYMDCLDRTLDVTKEPEWKDSKNGPAFCKYVIARHHFTEQHLKKYDENPKTFSFVKPFTLHGAKKYLYNVNTKEVYVGSGDESGDASYLQCPNVPSEVVKAEYHRIIQRIKGGSSKKNGDSKTKADNDSKMKADNDSKTKADNRRTTSSRHRNHDDDSKSVGTNSSNIEMIKMKDVENNLLKDQLDTMKNQLSFLQDMVEKLQIQHFDNGSVQSRNSRRTPAAGVARKGQQLTKKKGDKNKSIGATDSSACNNTAVKGYQKSFPDETDVDDDEDTEVRTIDDDSTIDVQTQATGTTFQSRPKPQQLRNTNDEESEEDDDEHDVYDYAETMSVGASTIMSASRSIKSLPRELELDDDENDTDSHESLEDTRSVSSSYQSLGTYGTHGRPNNNEKMNLMRKSSMTSKHNSSTSSTASNTNEMSDLGSNPIVRRRSIASSSMASSSAGDSKSLNLYEVKALPVTDPYGEKGTYTGMISRTTAMPHGFGRLEYDEAGRWYEGQWKLGRWTGHGRLSNGDGDYYEGELKNDLKHGRGFMKFADGRTFEGRYFQGQMVQGKMTYEDGSTYDGAWADGMRHGYGRCTFADLSIYQGEFKEGEFCGHGKMTWNDGGWFEGEWVNGEMHGLGKEVRPDGSLRHDGEWWRGQPVRQQQR